MDTQEAFVQSLADDAVSIDGTDYLPVGKPNSYKDYELIYYINDVTIDNEEVLVEYGAAGTATGTYEYGLQRLSVEHVNEAKEYYLYNGTGNVTQTTAENGSMFLRYTYEPFGNVTSINAPMAVDIDDLSRYTYNGEDYDYNTGLQYLRARYYSTGTGNFISQDTYLGSTINGLSLNRYTYVGNMPTMFNDPSGHIWAWAAGALIGGIVGAVSGAVGEVVSAVVEGRDIEVGKVLQSTVSGALGGATTGAVFAMTGNATLAGAAGGAVSGATNGVFREINDARAENRSVNWGNLAANVVEGAAAGGVGGAIGGAVFGKLGSAFGKPILSAAGQGYSLTAGQTVGASILSSVAGGSAARFTQTIFSNVRNPENAVSPFAAALNPKSMLTDTILGAAGGAATHLLTGGKYITKPNYSIKNSYVDDASDQADNYKYTTKCAADNDGINQYDDNIAVNKTANGNGTANNQKNSATSNKQNQGVNYDFDNVGQGKSSSKTVITPEIEEKILFGQRKNPTKNELIGGHSPEINNTNPDYAVELLQTNSDGTKKVKFVTQYSDNNLSKIKTSTLFPDEWSNEKIINSIKTVGDSSPIGIRVSDGAMLYRGIIDGVQIEVIKKGDIVTAGYPTGRVETDLLPGFNSLE